MITVLTANDLRKTCDAANLQKIIPELKEREPGIIGQQRAAKAFKLGLGLKSPGFNIYVSGVAGTGKLTMARQFLETIAMKETVPGDWCYVNNFKDPYEPKKLLMPTGKAVELKRDMKNLIQEARQSLLKAFESEEYAMRKKKISDKFEEQESALMTDINEKAKKESLEIRQTPLEVFTIPVVNGHPMTDEQFEHLPKEKKEDIQNRQKKFTEELQRALQENRKLAKAITEELSTLEKEVAVYAINHLIEETTEKYQSLPEVTTYLNLAKADILDNLSEFLLSDKDVPNPFGRQGNEFLKRYEINVLVDNTGQKGAPIIIERNPTYNNLIGRVEKESVMGTLVTDFSMIRKGSLHSANGGYLVIRAEELFKNFFSWEALKRTLRNKEIVIEEATDQLGYLTTKTVKPAPIPLNVKVILIGNPLYYYLLYNYDSEFRELFKIKADFDTSMDRTEENIGNYILFINSLCKEEKITPLTNESIARIVEHGCRLAEDQCKLSTRFAEIADVIREADHYAKNEHGVQILPAHIRQAIHEKWYRGNLIQEKINELIEQKQIFIDMKGEKTGQINGLAVIDLGDTTFGRPNRITCSVSLGKGGVIAIEREAELSGALHTKGVLILTGYLAEKFFQDKPVSLSARIVFEQSYSEVEGDSASSTELYAILSNLAHLPIKQGIAVTGSVNQKGEVQAIGGVNEKIEGYFEVCKQVGLDGRQGVIIPAANVRNLMLKEEITEAVRDKRFSIWAVDHVDDGIEILTGVKAGPINEMNTVAYLVNATLNEYAGKLKEFSIDSQDGREILWKSGAAAK